MVKFVLAWITAVFTMTLFSMVVNRFSSKEVREPQLIRWLLEHHPSAPPLPPQTGWIIHFVIGLLFMLLFEAFWIATAFPKTLDWALALGTFFGTLGIAGWILMFHLHPKKPDINFKMYYFQLFFAHIVFALTATGIYSVLDTLKYSM